MSHPLEILVDQIREIAGGPAVLVILEGGKYARVVSSRPPGETTLGILREAIRQIEAKETINIGPAARQN